MNCPAASITRFTIGRSSLSGSGWLATTTPIDRGTCRLRWHFFFPDAMAGMAEALNDGVTGEYGLQADVPIWRDKAYWEQPVLVKGDGDIVGFRRWYSQFYDDASD